MAKRIFILGKPGPDTFALQHEVEAALAAEGIRRCTVRIIDDEIVAMEFGVSLFPTLVMDEIVRAIGRVPPKAEIINLFHMIQAYVPPPKGADAEGGTPPSGEDTAGSAAAASETGGGSNGDVDPPAS